MMSSRALRSVWVDYAKAISICLMMLGHAQIADPYKSLFLSIVNPIFFFLAGMFATMYGRMSFRGFFKKSALHILVPYVFFNLLNYVFWVFVGRSTGVDTAMDVHPLLPLLAIFYGAGEYLVHYIPIWFLACLFTVQLMFYGLTKYARSVTQLAVVVIGALLIGAVDVIVDLPALPWELNTAFTALFFFVLGKLFWLRSARVGSTIFSTPLLVVLFLLAVGCLWGCYVLDVRLQCEGVSGLLIHCVDVVMGMLGIVGVVSFCMLLDRYVVRQKWLLYVGENTLVIYGLHILVFGFIKGFTTFVLGFPMSLYESQWALCAMCVVSLVLLVPTCYVLNTYFPILVGRKKGECA